MLSSFFTYFNRHVIQPLYYLKNKDARLYRLNQLITNQSLTAPELEIIRARMLSKLLAHCYESVPYYKNQFIDRGITPNNILTFSDLSKLPILTKDDIKNNSDTLISSKYERSQLIKDASGGSTGKPTIIYKDRDRQLLRRADQIRHDSWCGWKLGEPHSLIWGADKDIGTDLSFREKFVNKFIYRLSTLNSFNLSPTLIDTYISKINKEKPTMIIGYARALEHVANHLLTTGSTLNYKLKGIISSAETLTKESKKIIESGFNCKVYNRYGSREVGLIASECKHSNGLHVNYDNVHVEIIDEDNNPCPPGVLGRVIVTDLWNYGMPLIRYELGDVATFSDTPCFCGINFPKLATIEGRSSDFFKTKHNKLIHGEYFTHLFYSLQSVKSFQVVQESLDLITVHIVSDSINNQDLLNLSTEIKKVMDDNNLTININHTENIPLTPSGKRLFTISKI